MNYRAIAIQVGDLLKYDTTVPLIARAASAMFAFECKDFSNDSITSTRAKLFYDWVLSLADEQMSELEREHLLRRFAHEIAPAEKRARIDHILQAHGASSISVGQELVEALESRRLHPDVARHAQALFLQGNYFHAVSEAAKAYVKQVQFKAASLHDGEKLMHEVWGKNGLLRATSGSSQSDSNVQEGIQFLAVGLVRAIRNPTSHEPAADWPIGRQDCLDMLSFMSFLFRMLDGAHLGR